ncbi:MAG: hypothetical protein PVH61_37200 [Candidatus Aminicenantes bacterium]|jgi:hypothetical protein
MIRAKRALIMMMAPFLLFILTGCPDHDPKITDKSYTFIKSVEKNEFLIGERIKVNLLVKNKTDYDLKSLKILKETNPKGYRAIGGDFIETGEIYRRNGKVLTYEAVATSLGKVLISKSKIMEVAVRRPAGKIIVPEDIGFSNSIDVSVKPLNLKIHQTVRNTKVRVGGKIGIDLLVENDNDLDIDDMEVLFGGVTSGLRLLSPERISLRRWEHKKIRLVFLALQVGEIKLGQATINQLKFNDTWTCSEKNYGVSNPAPTISVYPVRLPGREFPIRHYTNEVKNFFDLLFLKILGVVVALLAIVILFARAINSRIVDSFGGRVFLWTLLVGAVEIILIFLGFGTIWICRTTPPDLWTIGMIYAISSGMALFSGAHPLRNPILGSLIAGGVLSLLGYLVFVGFSALEINGFLGFPAKEAALLFIAVSIAINSREFKRR